VQSRRDGLSPADGTRNTAEPSGELSKGDVVVAGEVALAVTSVGWIPVRGSLHEVRTDQHGTHPLPPPSPISGHGTSPGQRPQEGTAP
jgi:hypothetical protein